MRRLFIIFMILLMPFQSVWAVATAYCMHHEEGVAAQHIGHHAEEHPADDASSVGGSSDTQPDLGNMPQPPHSDDCHHYSVAGLLNDLPQTFHLTSAIPVHWDEQSPKPDTPITRIERPNWGSLA